MAKYMIDIPAMREAHEQLKQIYAGVCTVQSEISNQRQFLSLYDEQAVNAATLRLKEQDNRMENCEEEIRLLLDAADRICELSYTSNERAYAIISGTGMMENYEHMSSDVGDCTVPMNYVEARDVLMSSLDKVLASYAQELDRLRNDERHGRNGSADARRLAEIQEHISNYVGAIAVTNALAVWAGQTTVTGININSSVGIDYHISVTGSGISYNINTYLENYSLHSWSNWGLSKEEGLEQLQKKWSSLADHFAVVKDAAADCGWYRGFMVINTTRIY